MKLHCEISGTRYLLDQDSAIDISIPVDFNGDQPNSYDVPQASAHPFSGDGWVGDTRQGGSCNFDSLTIIPHCNGTHTECVGHIGSERISIIATLKDALIPASVISLHPVDGRASGDSYTPAFEDGDLVISRSILETALQDVNPDLLDALIIRTLPNEISKLTRQYASHPAPFFTREAMEYIVERNIKHLLVDFPGLDRAHDDGLLTAHHIYWDVQEGTHNVDSHRHSLKTVTEFIYVPNNVKDGNYMLNLQIAPFKLDAAPSRPILIPLVKANV